MKQPDSPCTLASRVATGREPARRVWLLLVLIGCLFGWSLRAAEFADPLEQRDFTAAARAFQDLGYERAEREFGAFVKTWTNSAFKAEAILRQAQARFFLTNSAGATELLIAGLPQSGPLAEQFQFWLAEAQFQAGKYAAAANTYALLVRDFPKSPHFLAAAHNEALARHRLGEQREKVVTLLRAPDGAFQRAARAAPTNSLVVSGTLLLGEVLLTGNELPAAEQAVRTLDKRTLPPEVDWQRRFLLGRILAAAGRHTDALPVVTNLVQLAVTLKQPVLQAESYALQGAVLEKLGRLAAAVTSFTNNFTTNTPVELRRRALSKAVELGLAQTNREPETIAMLDWFSSLYPTDPAIDFVQLTIGELRVKEFHRLAGGTNDPASLTNLLQSAVTNLNRVLLGPTNSTFLDRAYYQRGWCFWHQGRFAEAAVDFTEATRRLPRSEEQALARFKLAEAQAQLQDHTNALQNFTRMVEQYADYPRVRSAYLEQALYQLVRSALAISNLPVAERAVRQVAEWFPQGSLGDRAALLFGSELNRQGKRTEARREYERLLKQFPRSPLAPQVQLSIARTYREEYDTVNAARTYDEWVRRFPTNSARADVEFERAWSNYQAGATNALQLFTNFVATFPAHSNAALAQLWVGDFFFNQGQFDKAEESYQRLFQNTNWLVPELKYQAHLSAGRAAFFRQDYKGATNYFIALINDERVPRSLQAESFFALGDTYLNAGQDGVPIATDPYGDAIIAYSRITNNFPTNRLAAMAMGAIGNCHLQRAEKHKDPKQLELAADAYLRAMSWPGAEAAARTLAEVALGVVREKQGRVKEAAENWGNVFYQKQLRPEETPDLRQVQEAGRQLARLREEQQDWAGAILIYQRMQQMFPSRRAALEQRVERARQMLSGPK